MDSNVGGRELAGVDLALAYAAWTVVIGALAGLVYIIGQALGAWP